MKNFLRSVTRALPAALMCCSGFMLTACFDDDDKDYGKYAEWKKQNEQFVTDAEERTDDEGKPYYTRISPSWAPNTFVLVHWHNYRSLTANNLVPMDNSTTQITYELFDIDGKAISDSFSNPDSLYTSKPSQNIIGMWAALTNMHVGDTVTMVMPYQAGYGVVDRNTIPPYSTLIYNVKLKAVTAYEIP